MRMVVKVLPWLLLAAVAAATLVPLGLRPRTHGPVNLERALAYVGLGLAFAVAYPRRVWLLAAALASVAGGLEVLQTIAVDRHGRFDDFAVKAVGACLGIGLAVLARDLMGRTRRD